ncbi:MAG: Dam family site-specific DNA-(adenine-N6)-methyltransferase [Chloroflexi bacterium]|nr:Dam family site-specific DNA-(adenine-N6)-methyltransferase [Chloroflexota bacterium]
MAKPFLKWAGGKAKLAPLIADRIGRESIQIDRYHEPFLGGGAVFFALRDEGLLKAASLSDGNEALIETYQVVRDDLPRLVRHLREHARKYDSLEGVARTAYYYEVRDKRHPTSAAGRAARLIFLNKTCYNGLYRVNSKGHFNVPHGRYVRPTILDAERLREAAASLACADLRAEDFGEACARAQPGDFVYLDPPYQPLSATSQFTKYTGADFDFADQERLRVAFDDLTSRGVRALLSNSSHPDIHDLYRNYDQDLVPMGRAINSNGRGRAAIDELLVSNLSQVESEASRVAPARSRA